MYTQLSSAIGPYTVLITGETELKVQCIAAFTSHLTVYATYSRADGFRVLNVGDTADTFFTPAQLCDLYVMLEAGLDRRDSALSRLEQRKEPP